jgi:hypothetical protein
MESTTITGRGNPEMLAKVALGLGILAVVLFWGLGLAADSWWTGFFVGIAAVVVGWIARARAGAESRRLATIGIVLGAIPVVWFAGYIIIDAVS